MKYLLIILMLVCTLGISEDLKEEDIFVIGEGYIDSQEVVLEYNDDRSHYTFYLRETNEEITYTYIYKDKEFYSVYSLAHYILNHKRTGDIR